MAETVTTLTCDERAPSRARDVVAALLSGSSHAGARDEAILVVSELVSNAVRHGRCELTDVHVCIDDDAALIGVSDCSHQPPQIRPRSDAPGGLGMRIVDDLADGWWIDSTADGKTVWCRLRAPEHVPDAGRQDAPGHPAGL
ncbi:ATP-binding protein [Dermatobacter hominis]|uniref:ATP-binding protein n=1 Tax=Dermatobacter hominis TaxID=2884263 RepID=UPI001D0FC9DC|nr:ATP-binding protein [Dermatobacter hominis]UDY36730.1 ATP-binding protein [Dermatobacter hominis]